MICEHCGAFSCPDDLDEPPEVAVARRFCDKRCRRNHGNHRAGNVRRRARNHTANVISHAASCDRKQGYPSFQAALDAWAQRLGTAGGVYECAVCGKWHLTSSKTIGHSKSRTAIGVKR
jgi:hypothetical protein